MRKRPKHRQEDENHERWLITYSDMITLLLVFFIVLYSMSQVQQIRFNAVINSLKTAFSGQTILNNYEIPKTDNTVMPPVPKKKVNQANEKKLNQLYVKMQQYIKKNQLQTQVTLNNIPEGVQISFKDNILFDTGSAALKTGAQPVLNEIGGLLRELQNEVSVEGYTDNQPITSGRYPSNWELSGARARSVMYYMINHQHIVPKRMRFVGYGQYKPRAKNDTPAHRALNRRVNIIVLR